MSYQPQTQHTHEPAPSEPNSGLTGYAAIKYTAIVIITIAIIAFLVWALNHFFS